jgi:hypothetical protein
MKMDIPPLVLDTVYQAIILQLKGSTPCSAWNFRCYEVILTESSDLFKSREPGKLPFPKATTFNYVGYLVKDEDCERIGIVLLDIGAEPTYEIRSC